MKNYAILRSIAVYMLVSTAVISFSYTELPLEESDEYGAMTSSAEAAILNGRSIRMTGISVKTGNRTVRQCNLSYRRAANGKRINRLEEVNISGEGSYRMTYNEAGGFPGNGTLSVDHWGYYNGKNDGNSTNVPFLRITSNGKSSETITRSTRDADSDKAMTGILTRITYPTGGSSSFEYEGHDYSRAFVRDSLNHYEGGYRSSAQQDAVRALCNGSNAEVEFFEYIPLVGLGRYTDATGRVFTYEYNNSGKLKRVTDNEGKSVEEAYYSPDNRLSGIR